MVSQPHTEVNQPARADRPPTKIRWGLVVLTSIIPFLIVSIAVILDVERHRYEGNREGRLTLLGNTELQEAVTESLRQIIDTDQENAFGCNLSGLYSINAWNTLYMVYDRYRPDSKPENPLRGQEIVEIGCGQSMAHGVLAVLYGAKRYTCVEVEESENRFDPRTYKMAIQLARAIRAGRSYGLMAQRSLEDIFTVEDGRMVFNGDLIRLVVAKDQNYKLPELVEPGSADIVFSHSVLEHVADPERVAREVCVVLKTGGLSYHTYFGLDHAESQPYDPYAFLRRPMSEIEEGKGTAGPYYENRWRSHMHRNAVEASGLEIREWRTNLDFDYPNSDLHGQYKWYPVTDEIRETFVEPWRSMTNEQLSAAVVWFVAKKTKDCPN